MSEPFLFRVGDEHSGPPAHVSKFISEVKKVGGEVEIDGNTARIIFLPASVSGTNKAEVIDKYKDPEPAPDSVDAALSVAPESDDIAIEPAPEEVIEEGISVKDAAEEVVEHAEAIVEAAETVVEAAEAAEAVRSDPDPKPRRRGRPKKVVEEE